MRTVVVAHGEPDVGDIRWLDEADLVIAADGGAGWLDRVGRPPDALVGDLDSVDAALVERLQRTGTRVERHPSDKDATDVHLAVQAAMDAGATEIVLVAATGGPRPDHALANVLLLGASSAARRNLSLVHGRSVVRALHGPGRLTLAGAPGDLVSLLPIGGEAAGITTSGLRWALAGATLSLGSTRGLSNEVVERQASVSLDGGILLLVEIPAGEAGR